MEHDINWVEKITRRVAEEQKDRGAGAGEEDRRSRRSQGKEISRVVVKRSMRVTQQESRRAWEP